MNKPLTEAKILKLRPRFKFGGQGMAMVDWFKITKGAGYYCIYSGLRHADGKTKSPFHYEYSVGGKGAKKKVLEHFNNWWKKVKNNNIDG